MATTKDLPVTVNATANGDTLVIAAPGAGKQIVVLKGSVHNRGAAASPVIGLKAAANPPRWRTVLPVGGIAYFDFGDQGWALAPNVPLNLNLNAVGNVDVNVTEFAIEDL